VTSSRTQTDDLRRARAATRRFRNIDVARAAGYTATTGECAQDPKYGGMGIHYANPDLLADGRLDVTKPEVLVYHPMPSGRLRLGAVEYFQADADQDLATDPDRPYLFDLPFDGPMLGHEPGMPIHYDLHVWLYRHNPAGLFAAWNPRVHCPGAAPHAAHSALAPAPAVASQTIPGPRKRSARAATTSARPATAVRGRSSATSASGTATSASRS
jgi:hypothetical protein